MLHGGWQLKTCPGLRICQVEYKLGRGKTHRFSVSHHTEAVLYLPLRLAEGPTLGSTRGLTCRNRLCPGAPHLGEERQGRLAWTDCCVHRP